MSTNSLYALGIRFQSSMCVLGKVYHKVTLGTDNFRWLPVAAEQGGIQPQESLSLSLRSAWGSEQACSLLLVSTAVYQKAAVSCCGCRPFLTCLDLHLQMCLYYFLLTHNPQYTRYSAEVRDATTLLCTGPYQGFLRTNVNSVLSVSQSWRCGLWRREDACLSAQEISLLYLVQYVALYYICHSVVRSSTWAQVLAALPDPIGEGMISEAPFLSPLKRAAFVSGCRACPQLSVILAPLGELLKEEDVCLRKLFYFHHSTELCLRYWDDMSQF